MFLLLPVPVHSFCFLDYSILPYSILVVFYCILYCTFVCLFCLVSSTLHSFDGGPFLGPLDMFPVNLFLSCSIMILNCRSFV